VLKFAQAEDRILLTFDKDFGELAFVTELPATSGIILFRIQSPVVVFCKGQRKTIEFVMQFPFFS
jgi:hypothetical protein